METCCSIVNKPAPGCPMGGGRDTFGGKGSSITIEGSSMSSMPSILTADSAITSKKASKTKRKKKNKEKK
jgi:hypothetical protein